MDTVLICGGFLEEETAKKVLEKIKPDCIIGIDRGLEFCYRNQIYPQYILGDFDSVDKRILDFYENQKEIPYTVFSNSVASSSLKWLISNTLFSISALYTS